MSLKLIKPSMKWEEKHIDFINEWNNNKEEVTPFAVRLNGRKYYSWLENIRKNEKKETTPSEWVPASTYYLINEEEIIGAVNIRHKLNDYLFNYGGHIGYGIRPSERKKGYATKMLQLTLPIAKEIGLDKVLLVCNKDNIASAKTIQKNNGVLENEVMEDRKIVQRYWIKL